ncbi:hypothetical protein GDO86_010474 [Hymenochirus boettgeri]|uniref:Uncharacterized protein n=1 Tax=Hymenochirus boettgeri TaxID=247094 RepID=A0A8T2JT69_9PIPI|nr:hypothetical protein GDO86_010474 [Hymenochirus boettgeri]
MGCQNLCCSASIAPPHSLKNTFSNGHIPELWRTQRETGTTRRTDMGHLGGRISQFRSSQWILSRGRLVWGRLHMVGSAQSAIEVI